MASWSFHQWWPLSRHSWPKLPSSLIHSFTDSPVRNSDFPYDRSCANKACPAVPKGYVALPTTWWWLALGRSTIPSRLMRVHRWRFSNARKFVLQLSLMAIISTLPEVLHFDVVKQLILLTMICLNFNQGGVLGKSCIKRNSKGGRSIRLRESKNNLLLPQETSANSFSLRLKIPHTETEFRLFHQHPLPNGKQLQASKRIPDKEEQRRSSEADLMCCPERCTEIPRILPVSISLDQWLKTL